MEDKDRVPVDDAFPPPCSVPAEPAAPLHVTGQAEVRFEKNCSTSKPAIATACFSLDWLIAKLDVGGLSHVFVAKCCGVNLQRTNLPRQPYNIMAFRIALD